MRRLLIAALLALLLPHRGQAWGVTGHAIVADIAEHHLTMAALDQVHALLAGEGFEHLDQVASWPDTIRKDRAEASPWHYVDIPLEAGAYDPSRDCPNGDCAIEAIRRFSAQLADRAQPLAARREALKFLVHIVGDLHQPLHGAGRQGDHGGNGVPIVYFGEVGSAEYPLTLHWVWDTKIIERHLGVTEQLAGEPNLAARRAAALTANDLDRAPLPGLGAAAETDPALWAMESHEAAKRSVYPGIALPDHSAAPIALGAAYQKRAWPVVEIRLELAGLRLAALLNRALDGHT